MQNLEKAKTIITIINYRNAVSLPHKYKNTLVFNAPVMRST